MSNLYVPFRKRTFMHGDALPWTLSVHRQQRCLSDLWWNAPAEIRTSCINTNNPIFLISLCRTELQINSLKAVLMLLTPKTLVSETGLAEWITRHGPQAPPLVEEVLPIQIETRASLPPTTTSSQPSFQRMSEDALLKMKSQVDPLVLPAKGDDPKSDPEFQIQFQTREPKTKTYFHNRGFVHRYQLMLWEQPLPEDCPVSNKSQVLRTGDLVVVYRVSGGARESLRSWVFTRESSEQEGSWVLIELHGYHPHNQNWCLTFDTTATISPTPVWISYRTLKNRMKSEVV